MILVLALILGGSLVIGLSMAAAFGRLDDEIEVEAEPELGLIAGLNAIGDEVERTVFRG